VFEFDNWRLTVDLTCLRDGWAWVESAPPGVRLAGAALLYLAGFATAGRAVAASARTPTGRLLAAVLWPLAAAGFLAGRAARGAAPALRALDRWLARRPAGKEEPAPFAEPDPRTPTASRNALGEWVGPPLATPPPRGG
jgi:hypothetical protein